VKLKRIDLQEEPFSSAALIIDEEITDQHQGKMVAVVVFSSGGNIIYLHKRGYNLNELLVAAEKFLGETLRANRLKVFDCSVIPPEKLSDLGDVHL